MTAIRLRQTLHERVGRLEDRADGHDKMVEQVSEMYSAFKNAKVIAGFFNRFWSKALGVMFALVGFLAALLTIWERAAALFGHH